MSDREAEYRKETGKEIRPLDGLTRDWTMITYEYYHWLIQKLDKAEESAGFWEGNYKSSCADKKHEHQRRVEAEAERDELMELLDICRDFAEVGIGYIDKYSRDKCEMDEVLADIDTAINRIKEGR